MYIYLARILPEEFVAFAFGVVIILLFAFIVWAQFQEQPESKTEELQPLPEFTEETEETELPDPNRPQLWYNDYRETIQILYPDNSIDSNSLADSNVFYNFKNCDVLSGSEFIANL